MKSFMQSSRELALRSVLWTLSSPHSAGAGSYRNQELHVIYKIVEEAKIVVILHIARM